MCLARLVGGQRDDGVELGIDTVDDREVSFEDFHDGVTDPKLHTLEAERTAALSLLRNT